MIHERYLQLCLAATVSLATLLLGLGQQNLALPVLAVFAGATSVYFTDHRGWFYLNRHVANLAAIGAVGFATIDFIETDPNTRLLAIANLLVYLEVVLFYQQKNERLYWQLLVLSLLQVVVSAALNLGVEFGFLLGMYLLLALTSLGLLFVHCESRPFMSPVIVTASGTTHRIGSGRELWSSDAVRRFRKQSYLETAAATRPGPAMFNWEMVWQILKLSVTSITLTFLVFFLTPRFGKSAWQGAVASNEAMIGFNDEVSLGEIGALQEDDTVVMRLQFENLSSRTPYEVRDDIYLRGAVLSEYTPMTGMWRPTPFNRDHPRHVLPDMPTHREMVRQIIQIGPSPALFAVAPGYSLPETPHDLRMHAEDFQLFQKPTEANSAMPSHLRYVLATNAFRSGMQRTVIPCRSQRALRNDYLRFDASQLEGLAELTEEVIEASAVPLDDPYQVAKALEEHFLTPGNYVYTLSLAIPPPPDVDPTEYFATESHSGHCEYFASALALMLRSAGIPSRLVVGYYGADFNEVGNYYQVKNLHAHAWVEAWMDASYVPPSEIPPRVYTGAGVWVRLDPTPHAALGRNLAAESEILAKLRKCRDYFELLWNDYILGLDSERQQATIYRPLLERTVSFFRDILFSRKWWSTFRVELTEKLGMDSAENFRRRWFNWHAAPVLLGLFLLLVATVLLNRRRLWRAFVWLSTRPTAIADWFHRAHVQHRGPYRRLERVLKRHGLRRQPNQTPLEFCRMAAAQLKDRIPRSDVVEIPEEIAHAFYRERFGQRPLDATESQAVEHSLFVLESALATVGDSRPRRNGRDPTR